MKTIKVRIHKDVKSETALRYSDGSLHFVPRSGARVNVVELGGGVSFASQS